MTHRTFSKATALLTVVAGSTITAFAAQAYGGSQATTVGPVTATITELNYGENGTVNGFLVGTNVLLTFLKPVCGGIGTLAMVGSSVTYSGTAITNTSGFQTVFVSNFTNGSVTYPPATPARATAYPTTAGTIARLNYNPENGSIDGFVFTPSSGPQVLVYVGPVNTTLASKLTAGASVSVTGTQEAAEPCAMTGSITAILASSLTIAGTVYPIHHIY
jgi:hypothetical protein